jgi:5-methylcytosine-specific restriction endonuclease McrA
MDMLESIISKPTNRIFPYSIKEQLFNQNPTCAISGQKILKIEDAEVDHIVPYSKGGETTLSNAQLVLRYFNRSKKDNQDYKISQ